MQKTTRRTFLKRGCIGGAALALAPHARVLGANDDLRVATVGFGGQGGLHIRLLRELPGVRVVALCDADRTVLDRGLKQAKDLGQSVEGHRDVRKLLDDKNIDAVTTATPDHWHALVTVWACQAGKDVYVEKPLCHNLWEGRKMVEAARKYGRIVQFGNQQHGHHTGEMRLEMPDLGRILVAHTSLNRMRQSIGKVTKPQPVPESLDYNLWTGPAPLEPLMRKRLHYDWHWVWPTGTGEIGNNGVYPLDALRLRLGQRTLPKRVMSLGGRFLFDDNGETPNTQLALFQYEPGPMVIFELRNLPSEKGPKTIGAKIRCEKGESRLPGPTGPQGDTGPYSAHQGHLFNFVSAVRSRNVDDLRADVLEGHLSTALVHMANISYRLGTSHSADEVRDALQDRGSEAVDSFGRCREHLAANGVDFSKTEVVVGPWLEMDAQTERFVGESELVRRANALVRGHYREPFVIPEEV
ncbi:MAG: Gfo/Idh/MocA family oxidoreductase [Pirellulales bacterium]|nr:Gfo/Idh/MocA family oxidoreductase [Pirellulales bacterium]